MEIQGTVTITLRDYRRLEKAAQRGVDLTNIHEELLKNTGLLLTAISQDLELEKSTAERIMEHVKVYARSTKSISFYSSDGHIILKPKTDDKEVSDQED